MVVTRDDLAVANWRWLTWFAALYAAAVLAGAPWLVRWLFRRALREVLRQRDVRPSVCFPCGYDLRATATGTCPECGEKVGRKETTLRRVWQGQRRQAPPSHETLPPSR